ncbi:MAG TPA: nucleotide-binding protein [Bryobacteraceae bacterium]|jgi:predicted nucleotide-binding protein|nr:nucleotide-binding protein [Bryobacteraceae bacterium]
MPDRFGEWFREGDWYVRQERTNRALRRVREESAIGLTSGLIGLVTWAGEWKGNELRVNALGCESTVTYNQGKIVCRLKIAMPLMFMQQKILADVGNLTVRVAGAHVTGEKDVFIVHGHQFAARTQLRDICTGLGLKPLVLVEQDDLGFTVIEKFEYYARTCSFAFVIITPDDETAGEDGLMRRRARQNVIMELGWFMAYLGRDRVAILHQGDLEIPSDITGVITMRFDQNVSELAAPIATRLRYAGLIES